MYVLLPILIGLLGASTSSAPKPAFSILTGWMGDHDTLVGNEELNVEDDMQPQDEALCRSMLRTINRGGIPPRFYNDLSQPELPSTLKVLPWQAASPPRISATAHLPPTVIETMRECGKPPSKPGFIFVTCQYSTMAIRNSDGPRWKLIRMMLVNKDGKLQAQEYFTLNPSGQIISKLYMTGIPRGEVSVFKFGDSHYEAGWGEEGLRFSQGYAVGQLKRPFRTLDVARMEELNGEPLNVRVCSFRVRGPLQKSAQSRR